MATYTVLTRDLETLSKKIRHITNKCDKQGIHYTFLIGDSYEKVVNFRNEYRLSFDVTDIELDVQFKFNGWYTLGMVTRKDGIVQCYFNDAELLKQYKDTDFHCDHCHKHVHRNSVVLLEHENGERKLVGTACVKEFTQGLDGNLIAQFNDLDSYLSKTASDLDCLLKGENLDDIPISGMIERGGNPIYDIQEIVATASYLIRLYGFSPSGADDATWKYILDTIRKAWDDEDAKAEATKAIEWLKSLPEEEYLKSSYLFNLRQIIDADYCAYRHFSILTSLIPTYKKAVAKKISQNTVSNHVGQINEKFTLNLTYKNTASFDSQYGTCFFHFFTDEMGNVFKWSTNKGLVYSYKDIFDRVITHQLDQGALVEIKGTIKEHTEYKGVKQTVITRCKYTVLKSEDMANQIAKDKAEYEEYQKSNHNQVDDAMDSLMSDWM
jgi:hypothetical protein